MDENLSQLEAKGRPNTRKYEYTNYMIVFIYAKTD